MGTPEQQITAWPVVVPLAVVAGAVVLHRLHRRDALDVPRALLVAAVCVYGAGVLAYTVFPISVGRPVSDAPWWQAVDLVPLAGAELHDLVKNVVVFLPLGVLVPLAGRVRSARRVLVWGLLLSLGIEVTQLVQSGIGRGGHVADVDDLLANVVGAPLGYALFRACLHVPPLERLAAAATWPARRPAVPGEPVLDAVRG